MLCDHVVTDSGSPPTRIDDYVDLEWWELQRRALKKTSRLGEQLRILLPLGATLGDGSLITDQGASCLVQVNLVSCEVLIIHPRNTTELANLALELGNLHAPSEAFEGTLRTIPDGPVEELVASMALASERGVLKFNPRRCVGMPEIRVSPDFRVITR